MIFEVKSLEVKIRILKRLEIYMCMSVTILLA